MTARKTLTMMAAMAAVGVASLPSFAETDVYGNEIRTYTEGGVQKTYQFWLSDEKAEEASLANTSASSSNEDVALDAVFKSVCSSIGGWLSSVKAGFRLIFR